MNVEIRTESAQFPFWNFRSSVFAVQFLVEVSCFFAKHLVLLLIYFAILGWKEVNI
jgi:hypothetical protein